MNDAGIMKLAGITILNSERFGHEETFYNGQGGVVEVSYDGLSENVAIIYSDGKKDIFRGVPFIAHFHPIPGEAK